MEFNPDSLLLVPAGTGDLVHDLGALELVERRETLKLRQIARSSNFREFSHAWNQASSKFGERAESPSPSLLLLRRVAVGRLSFVIRVFHQHR